MKIATRCLLAIFAGLLVAWLLNIVGEPPRTYVGYPRTSPIWQLLLKGLSMSLAMSAPAFVAGFVANRYGWLVGAITSLIGQAFWFYYTGAPDGAVTDILITYGTRSVALSMIAGEAGQFLRQRLPPNNSFKPKPLRGSA